MMVIRYRSVLMGVALATLFVSTLAATEPSAAAAVRSAVTDSCDTTPVFFGLHGMGEGPSGTDPFQDLSPELADFDTAQNNISGAVLIAPVPYPTIKVTDLSVLDTVNQGKVMNAVKTGESNLDSALTTYTRGCAVSQDKIALVGYSMGAMVIDKWMVDHRPEWPMIKAVVLYGDPCWIWPGGNGIAKSKGLAWIFGVPACGLDLSYPYPWPSNQVPFQVRSWCANLDPVCGLGFDGGKDQLKAALKCAVSYCHHFDYTIGGADNSVLKQGAQFMVQQLGVSELA